MPAWIMDKQELWRIHACMWHGYCIQRSYTSLAWNCWCNLHIYVCTSILIVPIFLRIYLTLTLGIPSPVKHICSCLINLGISVEVELQSPLNLLKKILLTIAINNTVTTYILISLNWNSLEHSNHVTATKKVKTIAWV